MHFIKEVDVFGDSFGWVGEHGSGALKPGVRVCWLIHGFLAIAHRPLVLGHSNIHEEPGEVRVQLGG